MQFSGKVGNGPGNKRLPFGGDPDRDTGIIRALAEVFTVPLLPSASSFFAAKVFS